jgi:hypothetical protein
MSLELIKKAASVASNPTLSVHKNGTNQTEIVSNTHTLLTWPTEDIDVGGYFASNKWIPPEGVYLISAQVTINSMVADKRMYGQIYEDGVVIKRSVVHSSHVNALSSNVVALVETDGTKEYEIYTWHSSGANKDILGGSEWTFFQGFKLL